MPDRMVNRGDPTVSHGHAHTTVDLRFDRPLFRGPADRRWWHVELGDDAANWIMDVRVYEITGVRFVREPYQFPSFPGGSA